ncbi:hypothetical protein A2U01_0057318, partial [Trifolium medium]|nr:hypothetical protein [Trifolium medium]
EELASLKVALADLPIQLLFRPFSYSPAFGWFFLHLARLVRCVLVQVNGFASDKPRQLKQDRFLVSMGG